MDGLSGAIYLDLISAGSGGTGIFSAAAGGGEKQREAYDGSEEGGDVSASPEDEGQQQCERSECESRSGAGKIRLPRFALAEVADDGVGIEIEDGGGGAAGGKVDRGRSEDRAGKKGYAAAAETDGVGEGADAGCGYLQGGVVTRDQRDGGWGDGHDEGGQQNRLGNGGRGGRVVVRVA